MGANQVDKRFIQDDAVDGTKLKLLNGQYLRSLTIAGVLKNILRINTDDKVEFPEAPLVASESSISNALQTKNQLDQAVSAEASARVSADALLIPLTQRGAANGVATLGGDGKVPAGQLPSYVDDVLEYADYASFPATGETGKIYVALGASNSKPANQQYRWSGSAYQPMVASPGTTDFVMEGASNLYFTAARAVAALKTITDGLAARLTALEGVVWLKEQFTIVGAHLTNQYVDLSFTVKDQSLSLRLGRLALHEGEDYTLSVVAGKTRVTFAGDIATGGTQALVLGDKLYAQYQK